MYWPRTATLLVADTHWGKAATFRAYGMPLPGGTTSTDLDRLTTCITRTAAQRLVLLGDMLHHRTGRAEATFTAIAAWREANAALDIVLVRGNHDTWAGDPPAEWGMTCVDGPHHDGPFVYQHKPERSEGGYVLAGHLHPAAQLVGAGRQRLRLPCFWFGAEIGVLPAFGSFTGAAAVAPRPGDGVYVIAGDEIVPMGG